MSDVLDALRTGSAEARALVDVLYGDGAWEITKALSLQEKKRQKRQAQIGLASNVLGLAAGVGGTAAALRDDRLGVKEAPAFLRRIHGLGEKIPKPISSKTGKAGALLAGGALGVQLANNVGDTVANRVLARESKKKVPGQKVHKSFKLTKKDDAPPPTAFKAEVVRAGMKGTFRVAQQAPTAVKTAKQKIKGTEVTKNLDVTWAGEISKMDTDKRQVFGWASIVELDGKPVVDLQGDYMTVEEIEKAAYDYVRNSRKGGNQHERDENGPRHVSDMIESFLVTPEKKEQLGLPENMPTGWWVGFQVNDDETWAEVKAGKKKDFSIHGSGVRKELMIDD